VWLIIKLICPTKGSDSTNEKLTTYKRLKIPAKLYNTVGDTQTVKYMYTWEKVHRSDQ